MLCVTRHARHARSEKLIKLSSAECAKNQKSLYFYVILLQKIYKTETFHGVNLVFQLFER